MNFISLKYILFLAVAAVFAYTLRPKARNVVLLVFNAAFYALFGVKYLPFLTASVLLTYCAGIAIEKELLGKKRFWLVLSITLNIGMLFVFKYLGFFSELFENTFAAAGISVGLRSFDLLLPVGISFYVFQTTGYLMDVWRGKQAAETNLIDYALFASFFPGIVSGPIQRAGDMLPQYKKPFKFRYNNLSAGFLRFIWGMFKKIVVADRIAVIVNAAYADVSASSGFQLLIAAICYSIQIYCDFSAYSDMAIGSAQFLGIRLPENFRNPYFAVSIQDFWRRWHISLSTWFRDYLYFPLGGNRCSKARGYLNIIIVFLVSGLWHGAAMTFVAWGVLHGFLQVMGKILQPARSKIRGALKIANDSPALNVLRRLMTFGFVTLAWIFFRADSISDAVLITKRIFTAFAPVGKISALGLSRASLAVLLVSAIVMLIAERVDERKPYFKKLISSVAPRYAVIFLLLSAVMLFGSYGAGFDPMDFVYFKF